MRRIAFVFLITVFSFSCNNPKQDDKSNKRETYTPNIEYMVVKAHPHDVTSFTEGLLFHDNELYESTGSPENLSFTKSIFGRVDLSTGKLLKLGGLDKNKYFGEGISFLNGKLYQLTYQAQSCFVYDAKSFEPIGKLRYENKEGWGMTTDGESLIMSDGTHVLTYIDPKGFRVTKKLKVTQNGYLVDYLNELEFVKGFIYANVWTKNHIVKIDTANGHVVGILDLEGLFLDAKSKNRYIDVMNGIAYNPVSGHLFVTGKMWPNIYELDFYH
ncbi:MAG: glutaminyl-peptide cyclotransferase [Chlorobi bacterium]|nr:glutaminyl-peptide cyclotransferase [Chlorobiota bacterium]